ncbi:MAG: hypothetical protein VX633_04410, partial [Verrucomicrobiota bacterium]|nr:hypothetical protein [Verrucomicrobiota bacterium]
TLSPMASNKASELACSGLEQFNGRGRNPAAVAPKPRRGLCHSFPEGKKWRTGYILFTEAERIPQQPMRRFIQW